MQPNRLLASVIITIFLSGFAGAQAPAPQEESYLDRLHKAEQSLNDAAQKRIAAVRSAKVVRTGFQDKKGILWFGTNSGVYRYDGEEFIHYSTTDGLSSNQIFAIQGGKNGDLWIGTNGAGVFHYDGETFTSHLANRGSTYPDGKQYNIITSITEDASGDLWFTSISHADASRFDGEKFTHYDIKNGLSDDMIRSSYLDREGSLWFGTHGKHAVPGKLIGGLDRFDGETFTSVANDEGLLRGHVVCLYQDQTGRIWFGRGVGVMCIYDGNKITPFTSKDGKTYAGVVFLYEDTSGHLWFGDTKGKLHRYDGETVADYFLH